jgi:addiction module RelB/DinJ family antitoxin
MLHIRVDDELKARATQSLASVGLTVSDAVRVLLTRIAKEGGLPARLTADPAAPTTPGFGPRSSRRSPTSPQPCRMGR